MRLINTSTFQFREFPDERNVQYAILSHRWEDEEVMFQDWDWTPQNGLVKPRLMKGFYKIDKCCEQARKEGLEYAWVDTCCIDKKSSAELQEAINSMFRWYKGAEICYAYLSDVPTSSESQKLLVQSKWFTRGWTLQELVATKHLMFFSSLWSEIGPRDKFVNELKDITRIPRRILQRGFQGLEKDGVLIAQVMNWAKDRQTTRVEDRAYSLLGLFDVFMPMLYGEGERAFRRLQEELLKISGDQSIFAWTGVPPEGGLLAPSPSNFECELEAHTRIDVVRRRSSSVTSEGFTIEVDLRPWAPGIHLAVLNVWFWGPSRVSHRCIYLRDMNADGRFSRVTHGNSDLKTDFRPWIGFEDIRVVTVEHPEQSLKLYKNLQSPAAMFTIQLDSKWGVLERPKLQTSDLRTTVTSNETHIPMIAGRKGALALFDLSSPDLQVGRLRSIIIGIDWDFSIVYMLTTNSVVGGGHRWRHPSTNFKQYLDDEVPWVLQKESPSSFIELPSNDFSVSAVFGYHSSSLQTKSLQESDLGVRTEQRAGNCMMVINAGFTGSAGFDTLDALPDGLLCLKFEVGYPTRITVGKRYLSPY